jgi:phospholipase/lecithinase/hemolysin
MAVSYSGVFVFGDSLVDAGNALRLAETYDYFPFTSLPNGAPTTEKGYYKGRFTDGYTYADLISNKLIGVATKPVFPFGYDDPYLGISFGFFSDPSGNNLNFAYGGAQIRQGNEAVPDLDDQTDAFRDAVDGDADPTALHMLTFGGNDVHQMVPKSGAWMNLATATASMQGDAEEFSEEVGQLIEAGVRHILVTGVPDVGIQPGYNGTADEALRRAAATQYGQMLDTMIRAEIDQLRKAHPGVTITYVSFTGMQEAVFDQLEQIYPASALYPQNTSTTVFFDKLHPTAQLHALAAGHILDALNGTVSGDVLRVTAPAYRLSGSIGAVAEVDKLVLSLAANTTYTLEMLGLSTGKLPGLASWQVLADPKLRLLAPDGSAVVNDDGGLGLDARIYFTTGNAPGTYTLEMSGVGQLTGAYTLQAHNHSVSDDTYRVSNAAALVIEAANGGYDLVEASVSYALAAGSSVEALATTNISGTASINLTGNELVQVVTGNAGRNVLDGKGGADTLWGKAGADTFAFSTLPGIGNVDTIADFNARDDTIRLDNDVFTALPTGTLARGAFVTGSAARDSNDRIIFDNSTNTLYYDPDGTGARPAVAFAQLEGPNLNLTYADFVVI